MSLDIIVMISLRMITRYMWKMKENKKKEQVRKFPVFKPMAKTEHIYFKKDMLIITPKQFKEVIIDYAIHGGGGIRFVKNGLQKVKTVCQEGCKFVAYLTKLPRERSYQLRALTLGRS